MPPSKVPSSVAKLVIELADQQKDPAEIAQMLNLKKVQVSTLLVPRLPKHSGFFQVYGNVIIPPQSTASVILAAPPNAGDSALSYPLLTATSIPSNFDSVSFSEFQPNLQICEAEVRLSMMLMAPVMLSL